jgi:hypothetical protein
MSIAMWAGAPAAWTKGRRMPVQFVVVHHTAGSEGPTSAESGAAYDRTRTDGTSTHVFVDSNSVVCEVADEDRANHARFHGNEIGLGMELCGTLQTRAQWLDTTSTSTLQLAARWAAEKVVKFGLPVRRLTVAETRAAYYNPQATRPKGFVGHEDVTHAFPEDNGTHLDPGPGFPWDVFLGAVAAEVKQLIGGNTDMPKLVIIDNGPHGPGAVYKADGLTRTFVVTWDDAVSWASFWGTPTTNLPRIAWADADRLLGVDRDSLKGIKGDKGDPGTVSAAHTHVVSLSGTASLSGRSGAEELS